MDKQTSRAPQQQIAPQGVEAATGEQEFRDNALQIQSMQQAGAASDDDGSGVLAQVAFSMMQDAINDLWMAVKDPDPQNKVNAVQAYVNTVIEAQRMSTDQDNLATADGIEVVQLIMEQLVRFGDGQYVLQVGEMCQLIGIPVPPMSQKMIDRGAAAVPGGGGEGA